MTCLLSLLQDEWTRNEAAAAQLLDTVCTHITEDMRSGSSITHSVGSRCPQTGASQVGGCNESEERQIGAGSPGVDGSTQLEDRGSQEGLSASAVRPALQQALACVAMALEQEPLAVRWACVIGMYMPMCGMCDGDVWHE